MSQVNWRSHLIGLSEHLANASSSGFALSPSEFSELSPPAQLGLTMGVALSMVLMLGYCVLCSRGRGISPPRAPPRRRYSYSSDGHLSYESPTPEHLWYHPVRLSPHHLPSHTHTPHAYAHMYAHVHVHAHVCPP